MSGINAGPLSGRKHIVERQAPLNVALIGQRLEAACHTNDSIRDHLRRVELSAMLFSAPKADHGRLSAQLLHKWTL